MYFRHPNVGSFFESIKSWFKGEDTSPEGFASDLREAGISDTEARYYASEYDAGRFIVAVKPAGRWEEALAILRQHGAYDYNMRHGSPRNTSATQASSTQPTASAQPDYTQSTASAQSGSTQSTASAQPGSTQSTTTAQPDYTRSTASAQPGPSQVNQGYSVETEKERSIRLSEEMLGAEKQSVQTGEVTIHKEVVTEQKTIEVPVQHEEIVIERHTISGSQTSETPIGEGEVIRVPVREEQVHVTKTPIVTGEVSVGKRTVEEEKEFTDTVRREELHVEHKGDAKIVESDTDQKDVR